MNDPSPGRAEPQSTRGIVKWARVAFFWIGVLATLLGVFEGFGYLRETFQKWSEQRVAQTPLVLSHKKVELSSTDTIVVSSIVADTIYVSAGEHVVPDGSVWLANHVLLRAGASIKTHRLAIIAGMLEGGTVNASGQSGSSPGAKGGDGGDVVVIAGRLSNVQLLARGGDGAPGTPGVRGADGRDGSCAGFGGYRGADGGRPGGQGGAGGDGGHGGHLRVAVPDAAYAPGTVDIGPGHGGQGGIGGEGGHGGAGCVGLGGSQTGQPSGHRGEDGSPGVTPETADARGDLDRKKLDYGELLEIVRKSRDGDVLDANKVLQNAIANIFEMKSP